MNTIAEKTGFSETTIRRRVKLTELDQKKFADSLKRGGTLMDYAELEKIKDPDLRSQVLDYIGTNNFKCSICNRKGAIGSTHGLLGIKKP
jgi:ParB family chromosome partitioning protein